MVYHQVVLFEILLDMMVFFIGPTDAILLNKADLCSQGTHL